MTTHELKTLPSFFEQIIAGHKTFEIRKNDRDFKLHDVLILREIEPQRSDTSPVHYTGRIKAVRVTYITDWEQKPGNVVMAIELI